MVVVIFAVLKSSSGGPQKAPWTMDSAVGYKKKHLTPNSAPTFNFPTQLSGVSIKTLIYP